MFLLTVEKLMSIISALLSAISQSPGGGLQAEGTIEHLSIYYNAAFVFKTMPDFSLTSNI